jgi:hypothetical protein
LTVTDVSQRERIRGILRWVVAAFYFTAQLH